MKLWTASSGLMSAGWASLHFLVADVAYPVGDGRLGGGVLSLARPTSKAVVPECAVVVDIAGLNKAPVLLFTRPYGFDARARARRRWQLCLAHASHRYYKWDADCHMIQPLSSSHMPLVVSEHQPLPNSQLYSMARPRSPRLAAETRQMPQPIVPYANTCPMPHA